MSQVLVWKSDEDGKLFEIKSKYTAHLRKLAEARMGKKKVAAAKAAREQFLIDMGNTVTSVASLEQFIQDNWSWFAANGASNNTWRGIPTSTRHKLVSISITAKWSNHVSNSHSCPRGGVTNWSSFNAAPGTPTGYPGWIGSIAFTIDAGVSGHKVPRKYDGFGPDYFENTALHTGSGGGGDNNQYGYELKLFAADFPRMTAEREKEQVWEIISDGKEYA
jgi:hypothetical protein